MKHVRAALATTGTAVLSAAFVLGGAGAANAYPAAIGEVDAVVFSNGNVVDVTNEYLNITADLETFGLASVTAFDGGDGSAAAWSAALTGVELLVMPEQEEGNFYDAGGHAWVSDAALAVIKAWVEAGNLFIVAGDSSSVTEEGEYFGNAPLVGSLTCLAIANDELFTYDDGEQEYFPAVPLTGAPDPLPWRDGTYAFVSDAWSAPLSAIATPIYVGESTVGGGQVLNTVAAATFGVGNGAVIYLAYDWFELDSAEWYNVLQLAASGAFPYAPQPVCGQPQLAATGAEVPVAPIAAGAAFLLLAGVLAFAAARRRTA